MHGMNTLVKQSASSPVRVFTHHLEDTEQEGFVAESAAHAFLVDPELCCCY